jgi:hypothetical protein
VHQHRLSRKEEVHPHQEDGFRGEAEEDSREEDHDPQEDDGKDNEEERGSGRTSLTPFSNRFDGYTPVLVNEPREYRIQHLYLATYALVAALAAFQLFSQAYLELHLLTVKIHDTPARAVYAHAMLHRLQHLESVTAAALTLAIAIPNYHSIPFRLWEGSYASTLRQRVHANFSP